MRLEIEEEPKVSVDRDGIAHFYPQHHRQGINIDINGLRIHFEDEADASKLAKMILERIGEK